VALRQANARFAQRFAQMEAEASRRDLDLSQLSLDELEALWQDSK